MGSISLKFLGAAGTVTGSRHLLEIDAYKILVDCGLFQGLKELRLQNREPFPFEPNKINFIILTHAHLDHIGHLPVLCKNGFNGKVFCSKPTSELAKILLMDAAHIEEEDASYANQKKYSKHSPAEPLFSTQDVAYSLKKMEEVETDEWIQLGNGIQFRLRSSGHIIGSTFVEIEAQGKRIVFSGDLGRSEPLTLEPKKNLEIADYLVIESTYGDRVHAEYSVMDEFQKVILDTLKKRGHLLIPSFAVGRTQDILYLLYKLKEESRIPNIPIYLDSPLAKEATEIFLNHPGWLSLEEKDQRGLAKVATVIKSRQQSKDLLSTKSSTIVIAGSGMVTGGRILHHLAHRIHSPKNTILLVGFQAAGTRGRQLKDGVPEIKMHGEYFPVRAEVKELSGLSAHADQHELLDWLKNIKPPKKTFIVHGEPQASDFFRVKLRDTLLWDAIVPKQYELFHLP